MLATHDRVARFDPAGGFAWVAQLRKLKRIPFSNRERDTVLASLLESAVVPPLELDEALQFEQRKVQPELGLKITERRGYWGEERFHANLLLNYGRGWTEVTSSKHGVWFPEERVYLVRDAEAETAARETLKGLGLRAGGRRPYEVAPAGEDHAARRAASCFAPVGTWRPRARRSGSRARRAWT